MVSRGTGDMIAWEATGMSAKSRATQYADSDEAARVYRTYSAHRSNLMPPTNPI